MAHEEKSGKRNLAYSAWHRYNSIIRYVTPERAESLSMIDIDGMPFHSVSYVEYHDKSYEPLVLLETAEDTGADKCAGVLKRLAARCEPTIPAFILLYTCGFDRNPAQPDALDIVGFRYRRVWPEPETSWRTATPQEWALKLDQYRKDSAKLFLASRKENNQND